MVSETQAGLVTTGGLVIMGLLLLNLTSTSITETERAVYNFGLIKNASIDSEVAYAQSLIKNEGILGKMGLLQKPEQAREELLIERESLKEEVYDIQTNVLTEYTEFHVVGTRDISIIVSCDPPIIENKTEIMCYEARTENIVETETWQMIVTPTTIYQMPHDEKCWQDTNHIYCENEHRCNMEEGLELGCEAAILSNDVSEQLWDIGTPMYLLEQPITQRDLQ